MSKISLAPNISGTGTFTIAAPNSNTNRTLTLPDQTGTVLTGSGPISVNASAPTSAVTLDASGNLGVGSTSPAHQLDVANGARAKYIQVLNGAFTGNGATTPEFYSPASGTLAIACAGEERARIDSSGNLLVGTTSTAGGTTISTAFAAGNQAMTVVKSAVAINTNYNYYLQFNGSNGADGYINTNGSAVLVISDASDVRLKENIVDATYGVNTIMALRPVEYSWIGDDRRVKGFIAQEVKNVLPESVSIKDNSETGGLEDMHLLEMQTMIPVIVKAIQEQQAIITALTARIEALEAK